MPERNTTGREPYLSGAPLAPTSTGQEPALGGEHGVKQVREYLLDMLTKPTTSHLRRIAIGEWLATHGDSRPGVGLNAEGLPDLVWCAVPGGDVQLRDATEPHRIERFNIAKYPITWAQYRIFLEAEDGHAHPYWWDDLRYRADYERHDALLNNQPAQEVSWYDAVAYCRWLSSKMDYDVRLPNEWEWQMAASDGNPEMLFPWGSETGLSNGHSSFANTRESSLHRATAVGMYPNGEAPCGALDMAGTVLEWCTNEFANPERTQISGSARRVLRGGSWFLIFSFARNSFRTGDDPYFRFNSVGLRLAADSLTPRPKPAPPPPIVVALPVPEEDPHPEANLPEPGDPLSARDVTSEDADTSLDEDEAGDLPVDSTQ